MSVKWIVVVTRANARVFTEKSLSPIVELKYPLGRAKNREMTSGKPGVGRNRVGAKSSTHNMGGKKDPHEEAAVQFAQKIDAFLCKQMNLNRFDGLLIVAEPKMTGRLKKWMDVKLQARCEWMNKDLGKLSAHQLKRFLVGGTSWSATAT